MDKLQGIKNVFFDLDDTLWACSVNAKDTLEEVYNLYEFDLYFDSFNHFYSLYAPENDALWGIYAQGALSKRELNLRRFSYPLLQVGVENKKLVLQYSTTFFERIKQKRKLMPGAFDLLTYLEPRYNLYVLSNGFRELQFSKMSAAGITHFFDQILLSEDFGVMKPHSAIFQKALNHTNSSLNNSIMIGDSWEADILGAKKIGMLHIFYNSRGIKMNYNLQVQCTYCVDSLHEIKKIL